MLDLNGWSSDILSYGSGGGLLQDMTRDTFKFAFKASCVKVNGEWRDVVKDPITDPGKRSKAGCLALFKDLSGKYTTIRVDPTYTGPDELEAVFRNGHLLRVQTLDEIRNIARYE